MHNSYSCRSCQHGPGKWSCEPCLRTRLPHDSAHVLEKGCRFADDGLEVARRTKKQVGQRAGAGPCRDPAIPASGAVDGASATDDLGLGIDGLTAYDEAIPAEASLGIFKACGRVAVKEEKGGR